MTPDQFTSTAIAILRSAVGWQSAIARRLDVDSRTVRRWLKSSQIPDWATQKLAEMTGTTDITAWPRDEWMIGDIKTKTGTKREYIAHLQPPRFVARIVPCHDDGQPAENEHPADVLSGIVYDAGFGEVLCEIAWIDEVHPGEYVKWLEAAADIIEDNS